jgi:hypothetical protein
MPHIIPLLSRVLIILGAKQRLALIFSLIRKYCVTLRIYRPALECPANTIVADRQQIQTKPATFRIIRKRK